MLQQSCSRGPRESRTNTVSTHWETGPWPSKCLDFPGCWKREKTPVAKAHRSPRDVAAEDAQGLLENTSSNALSRLEVLLLSHWLRSYTGETRADFPASGFPVVLGTAMRQPWSVEIMLQVHLRDLYAASTLQGSLGSGWLPVGHQGIPFHTMNLWLHFGCTCIFHSYHCNTVNGYSDHFSVLLSSLLFNDFAVLPLKPQSSKHLQIPLTFQPAAARLCDLWDELGRQKHRGKVYGLSVCFSWQIQSRDFSFSRWQVSFKTVFASQNIL